MTSERQTEIYGSKEKGPTKILNFLYLGSQADALNNDILKKYDIKAILNITIPCIRPDKELINDANFLNIELKDNFTEKILPHFDRAFEFIDRQRDLKNNILIHCLAGISRSATFCIAYLMKHLSIDHSCAYSYVKSLRSSISPNFNFLGQLFEYETNLKKVMSLKHEIPKIDIINYSSSSIGANECKKNIITLENYHIKEIPSHKITNDTTKIHFFKNKNGKRHLHQQRCSGAQSSLSHVLRPSLLSFDKSSSLFKNDLHNHSTTSTTTIPTSTTTTTTTTTISGADKFSPSTEFANISLRTYTIEPLTKIPLTLKEEEEVNGKIKTITQDTSNSSLSNMLACENPTFDFTTNCLSFHENFSDNKRKNYGKIGQRSFFDDFLKKNGKRSRRSLFTNDSSKLSCNNELPFKKFSLDHSSSLKSCDDTIFGRSKVTNKSIMDGMERSERYEDKEDCQNLPTSTSTCTITSKNQSIPTDVEVKVLIKSKSSANVDKDGEKVNCHVLRKSLTLIFNSDKRQNFSLDQKSNDNNNILNINNNYDITPQTPSSRPLFLSISQSHHTHHHNLHNQQLPPPQSTPTSSINSSTTSATTDIQTSNHLNGRDPDRDSIGSNSSHEITVN